MTTEISLQRLVLQYMELPVLCNMSHYITHLQRLQDMITSKIAHVALAHLSSFDAGKGKQKQQYESIEL